MWSGSLAFAVVNLMLTILGLTGKRTMELWVVGALIAAFGILLILAWVILRMRSRFNRSVQIGRDNTGVVVTGSARDVTLYQQPDLALIRTPNKWLPTLGSVFSVIGGIVALYDLFVLHGT